MRSKRKVTGSVPKPRPMIKKESSVGPARKSRTRTRKPKYISLRLELSPENTQQSGEMPTSATNNHQHQLNLFPLHPENLVEEKDTQDENVAYFFSAVDGGATTLTGLLGAPASSASEENDNNTLSPESLTYGWGGQDSEGGEQLVRTAMRRNKEIQHSEEEKWVSYSEVTSCSPVVSDLRCKDEMMIQRQRLSLKLDYEEIMNAWSDKGPLYIHVDSPQVVPDLHDDEFFGHPSTDGWGTTGGLWRVPEMSQSNNNNNGRIKVEDIGEEWKTGHREASVLRYKEKRQNRLFSKRIRYEVRKLNAEKRPRVKGRFVKRD